MSLTQTEDVFGGIHETAVNNLLHAFFTARPRYLHYASPGFASATTANVTQIGAIPFPNVPGGIDWAVTLAIPVVDLFPETLPLPPPLTLGAGQLSVRTTVTVCLGCRHDRINPEPPQPPGRDGKHPPDGGRGDQRPREVHELCCRLGVFAVGHLERVLAENGEPAVAVAVDSVELTDVKPDDLEAILACLLLMVLRAVLADVRLPLRALRAGAFTLQLVRGPLIEDDQVKVYGTL